MLFIVNHHSPSLFFFFFFNDTATTEIYTLSLHDALPISREQGIAYIRDHTRVPRLRAEVPVDRYPIWPAQGLSYAIGRLEIRRLRAAATSALGSRFDVREFHDRVLADGAVPLPLLQENIERWIAAAR